MMGSSGVINATDVETIPGCYTCALKTYCGTDPIRNYVEQNDIMGHMPTSNFCKKNKQIISWLLERIREDNEKVMDVFWSWVTKRPLRRVYNETVQGSCS